MTLLALSRQCASFCEREWKRPDDISVEIEVEEPGWGGRVPSAHSRAKRAITGMYEV